MRLLAVFLAVLCAGCSTSPGRKVFLPPYAEKGCWARFYERADFGAPMRQLEGPSFVEAIPGSVVVVPNMEEAGVQPLFVEARSLMVGSHAKLVGYAGTLFRGETTVVDPGTLVRDTESVGYSKRFASLRLLCEA